MRPLATEPSGARSRSAANILPAVLAVLLLALMVPSIVGVVRNQSTIIDGPQEVSSQELWSYLRSHANPADIIVFRKPFALNLYSGRTGHVVIPMEDPLQGEAVGQAYREKNVALFVVDAQAQSDLREQWLDRFVASSRSIQMIWDNGRFKIYAWSAT